MSFLGRSRSTCQATVLRASPDSRVRFGSVIRIDPDGPALRILTGPRPPKLTEFAESREWKGNVLRENLVAHFCQPIHDISDYSWLLEVTLSDQGQDPVRRTVARNLASWGWLGNRPRDGRLFEKVLGSGALPRRWVRTTWKAILFCSGSGTPWTTRADRSIAVRMRSSARSVIEFRCCSGFRGLSVRVDA